MKKKFYTFAELSNYIDILEKNKDTNLKFRKIYDDFGAWIVENVDPDTLSKFWDYHRKKNTDIKGTEKIYPKRFFESAVTL